MAYAGLKRVGLEHRVSQVLDDHILYYAVGQGALAIECREDDEEIKQLANRLEHRETRICIEAEREFMRCLEGGCSVPLGVTTHYDKNGRSLELKGCICSLDGRRMISDSVVIHNLPDLGNHDYSQALEMARQLGRNLAKNILNDQESLSLLNEIRSCSSQSVSEKPQSS
jgi:hydroxymethylbilane synthase